MYDLIPHVLPPSVTSHTWFGSVSTTHVRFTAHGPLQDPTSILDYPVSETGVLRVSGRLFVVPPLSLPVRDTFNIDPLESEGPSSPFWRDSSTVIRLPTPLSIRFPTPFSLDPVPLAYCLPGLHSFTRHPGSWILHRSLRPGSLSPLPSSFLVTRP